MSRQALPPSSALPLIYFGWAHAALALACVALAVDPALPGGYFLHPRMAAIVHLVTIGWITGSILGASYVVAPLALGMPLPARFRRDCADAEPAASVRPRQLMAGARVTRRAPVSVSLESHRRERAFPAARRRPQPSSVRAKRERTEVRFPGALAAERTRQSSVGADSVRPAACAAVISWRGYCAPGCVRGAGADIVCSTVCLATRRSSRALLAVRAG